MNQNLSKSKLLHESSKLEHFQWGGGKNYGGTNLGDKNFGPLKSLGSNNYHICNILDWG